MGYAQAALICFGIIEVARRFMGSAPTPDYFTMIWISVIAFAVNAVSLWLLIKLKSPDANIKATVLCSSVDCLTNLGVILTAVLVRAFDSAVPDLIVGLIVFAVAMHEALEMIEIGRGRE
jgi:Co/Zn/Cd efflux system component